jgi:DNA-binding NarL/FixJ family response regulator
LNNEQDRSQERLSLLFDAHSSSSITIPLDPSGYMREADDYRTTQTLEERVQHLESQNDILLQLVHFFKDVFPDLSKLIPQTFQHLYQGNSKQKKPADADKKSQHKSLITKRELEVLQLIAEGLSAKEIAHKLYISETTVITHKKNLKEKFNVRNTAELVRKTSPFLQI